MEIRRRLEEKESGGGGRRRQILRATFRELNLPTRACAATRETVLQSLEFQREKVNLSISIKLFYAGLRKVNFFYEKENAYAVIFSDF